MTGIDLYGNRRRHLELGSELRSNQLSGENLLDNLQSISNGSLIQSGVRDDGPGMGKQNNLLGIMGPPGSKDITSY